MLGGVAEELRRQRRSRNFDFHGSPAERIYAGEELRRQRRSRNFDFHGSPAERICAKNLDENASTRFHVREPSLSLTLGRCTGSRTP
jgi:hypothetical protein